MVLMVNSWGFIIVFVIETIKGVVCKVFIVYFYSIINLIYIIFTSTVDLFILKLDLY